MPYPRFSTLCTQAQKEIDKRVKNMQDELAQLTDVNNQADAFFACGMSFRLHGNDKMDYAREIIEDASGDALLNYLQDDSIIKPSPDKQKLIATFRQNPSFSHKMFVEGYEYEKKLQASSDEEPVSATVNASQIVPSWDAAQWLKDFNVAQQNRETHGVRINVWQSTLAIVKAGAYVSKNGVQVKLPLNPNILSESRFYKNEIPSVVSYTLYNTKCEVHACDCLEFAKSLHDKDNTDDLCVLNLASYSNPGGGVRRGDGAQEEYLFRCSDYFRSLYQYVDYCQQYGMPRAPESYPLDRDFGGVFSHGVTVFREKEADGYALVDIPWHVNFIAAAVSRLPVHYTRIPDVDIPLVVNTIRTILRIAYTNGQRRLVLGALGCGAFNNPPQHMAQLFKQVLQESEFDGVFKEVHFAIFDDHNARRKGVSNVDAFRDVFSE